MADKLLSTLMCIDTTFRIPSLHGAWRSNVGEARSHAKRVIYKARRQGNLDELETQIEKMVSKGAFQQLSGEEILELAEKPHLFTQYNWVHNPGSLSNQFRYNHVHRTDVPNL